MRSGVVLGLVLGGIAAGCGFRSPPGAVIDDTGTGGGTDSCVSFASLLDTCPLMFEGDLMITAAATYNTMTHVLMMGTAELPVMHKTITIGGDEVDVISARNVQLAASATLHTTGPRALAIAASDSLTVAVDAQIDVSAGGAGAQISCANGATKGQDDGGGSGGGGGGGFGADGGDGGIGNRDGGPTQGGSKGHAVGSLPAGLHGGCPGAKGGDGDAPGGSGGAGGGALYVVAANQIQFTSSAPINAGGGGGRGGQHNGNGGDGGGGGGGSGGLVILEAPHIIGATAVVAANGGGGGEGSENANAGGNGTSGSVTTSRALGGSGMANTGGDGGRGGSMEGLTGEPATSMPSGGGGGGGGGVGFIRLLSNDHQIMTSPDPS